LSVISLNTLYFYDSNKAVGGCEWVNRAEVGGEYADPGNLELDWVEVQLELFRQRGIKVCVVICMPSGVLN
jgi:endopolyphosphatase